jgi:hypothetical protein
MLLPLEPPAPSSAHAQAPSPASGLLETLKKHGISIVPDFSKPKQSAGPQYLIYHRAEENGRVFEWARFGDHRRGIYETWAGDGAGDSAEARSAFLKAQKEAEKAEREEKERLWSQVAEEARHFVRTADRSNEKPSYLTRKKIPLTPGAFVSAKKRGAEIIVPMQDEEGRIWNYLRILPKKVLNIGDKLTLRGGRVTGVFFPFGAAMKPTARSTSPRAMPRPPASAWRSAPSRRWSRPSTPATSRPSVKPCAPSIPRPG